MTNTIQKFNVETGTFVDVNDVEERNILVENVARQIAEGSKLTIREAQLLYGLNTYETRQLTCSVNRMSVK